MHSSSQKFSIIISCIGVFLLVLALRGNSITTPFERDEGEYAYSARLLLRGGVPYKESFLQKPPLIVYTYALGQLFDPYGVASPRILAIIFIVGTIYLVGYIAHREFGWVAGISSMWIVTPMLSFPYLAALAANTEIFMLFPLTATVALYVRSKSEIQSPHTLHILAGFFATTAILYKPIAIFPLAFLFMVLLARPPSKEGRGKALVQVVVFWSTGCIISLVIFLGYFLIRGAGPALWESTVVFSRYYASFFELGFGHLAQRFTLFFFKWTPLIILLLWSFVAQLKRSWLFFGLLLSSLIGVFQTPIGHYYLIIMPFWAILIALGISGVASFFEQQSHVFFSILLTIIVIVYMLLGIGDQFTKTPEEIGKWVYGQGNPFAESMMMGNRVAKITGHGDDVFIAGSEPQILNYADRKSSSRFVITYPFVIDTPMRLAYQREGIRELGLHPPQVIVLSQRAESGLWDEKSPQELRDYLHTLLKTKYNLVGATVWESDEFAWMSSPTESNLAKASLLLFTRR